jgi:hypothetical protein
MLFSFKSELSFIRKYNINTESYSRVHYQLIKHHIIYAKKGNDISE